MKHSALALLLLLLSGICAAQTTYTQVGDAFASRSTTNFSVEGVQFTNGLYLGWIEAADHYACPNQASGPYEGWIFYTLNGVDSPCIPVTGFFYGPPAGQKYCNFPASIHVDFQGGTYDAEFLWYYGGIGRSAGCYRKITSATITLQ